MGQAWKSCSTQLAESQSTVPPMFSGLHCTNSTVTSMEWQRMTTWRGALARSSRPITTCRTHSQRVRVDQPAITPRSAMDPPPCNRVGNRLAKGPIRRPAGRDQSRRWPALGSRLPGGPGVGACTSLPPCSRSSHCRSRRTPVSRSKCRREGPSWQEQSPLATRTDQSVCVPNRTERLMMINSIGRGPTHRLAAEGPLTTP